MGLSSTADIVRYAATHGLIEAPENAVSYA
jgi:hypothetical protein